MNKPPKPYHHGDLHAAFLSASEAILESEGIQALTVRAAARAVGVSHTALQNHFGDLSGLLSDLAGEGYRRFADAIAAAMVDAGADPKTRMRAMGHAYIGFARAHPGLFTLMFRSERLDFTRPALRENADRARQSLATAIAARAGNQSLTPQDGISRAAASWSLIHGFAVLMLDGRLRWMASAMGDGIDEEDLLDGVFGQVEVGKA